MSNPSPVITRVEREHWSRFRAMRVAALAESPAMFGSTSAREAAFNEQKWRRRAQRPVTFLASLDGTDVGLVGVHEFDGNWTVVSMWISPETRGLGIVDALMEACENVARQAGSDSLILGVMEENTAGRRAYRRLGFEPIARRDHVGDGRIEMWMAKSLKCSTGNTDDSRKGRLMEQAPVLKLEPSGSGNRSKVELVFVDEDVLEELVAVATTDAAPDEVTPPLGKGWTPERVKWLHDFHRRRREGLTGDEKEETAAISVDGRMIGATRLHRASSEAPDHLEWGIWIARSSRGLGLSDAVLRLLAARARMVGASRLVAETTATNAPMIATLRRAGAMLEQHPSGAVHAEIPLDDERS